MEIVLVYGAAELCLRLFAELEIHVFNYVGAGLALIVGYRRAEEINHRTLGSLQDLLKRS